MASLEKIVETGQKISDAVHTAYVAVLGNRVTATATITSLNYICGTFSGFLQNPAYFAVSTFAFLSLGSLWGPTFCGKNTLRLYKRTRQHIRNFGRLDEWFVKQVIDCEQNECICGYCEQQGVYLAALHEGQTKVFRKVQKQYSHVKVPFF